MEFFQNVKASNSNDFSVTEQHDSSRHSGQDPFNGARAGIQKSLR